MKADLEKLWELSNIYYDYAADIHNCRNMNFRVGDCYIVNGVEYRVLKDSLKGNDEVLVRKYLDNGYCSIWVFKAFLVNGQ